MRLSDWRGRAPYKDAMSPKVVAVIEPLLAAFGSDPDPMCWVVWGDDPASRYIIFVPTAAGLLQVHVRVNVPQEGPRTSGKLIRWNRVQTGELAMELAGGHRLLSFQAEGQVLRGSDDDADAIAAFALTLFAAIDGRAPAATAPPTASSGRRKTPGATSAATGATRSARRPPTAGH